MDYMIIMSAAGDSGMHNIEDDEEGIFGLAG